MFTFMKQKNSWREYLKRRKYFLSSFGTSPRDDWRLVLLIFIFFLGLISVSGIFTYKKVIQITDGEFQTNISSRKIIEVEKINTVIDHYQEKEDFFDRLFINKQ